MDPMFGLPAIRESKHVEDAQFRNRTQQRKLKTQLRDFENKLNVNKMKIIETQNYARELLQTLTPRGSNPHVMCPSGFSQEEKTSYQQIHKSNVSIPLSEFDRLLNERRVEEYKKRVKTNNRDTSSMGRICQSNNNHVVHQQTNASMTKCKHVMRGALERFNTSDIQVKDKNMNDSRRGSH